MYGTEFTLVLRENAMGLLCQRIMNNIRGTNFTMEIASNYYPFGREHLGTTSFTCIMANNDIEVVAKQSQWYEIKMKVVKNA
jgi:hypothetical protein